RIDLVDEGGRRRHRRQPRTYVGKAPGRNRVPDVLDGRVVVDGSPPEESVAVDVDLLCDAYVRIVPGKAMADAVPRSLNEGAEIVGELPPVKRLACCRTNLLLTPNLVSSPPG